MANNPFNKTCRVFYPNSVWDHGNNIMKTGVHYNKTFDKYSHNNCKCDNIKKKKSVEVSVMCASNIHVTLHILDCDILVHVISSIA